MSKSKRPKARNRTRGERLAINPGVTNQGIALSTFAIEDLEEKYPRIKVSEKVKAKLRATSG